MYTIDTSFLNDLIKADLLVDLDNDEFFNSSRWIRIKFNSNLIVQISQMDIPPSKDIMRLELELTSEFLEKSYDVFLRNSIVQLEPNDRTRIENTLKIITVSAELLVANSDSPRSFPTI